MDGHTEAVRIAIAAGKVTEPLIEEMDKVTPSPNIRTEKVWSYLSPAIRKKEISNWDIICFCTGYLAKQVSVYPAIKETVIDLGKYVMHFHYLFPNISSQLDKQE